MIAGRERALHSLIQIGRLVLPEGYLAYEDTACHNLCLHQAGSCFDRSVGRRREAFATAPAFFGLNPVGLRSSILRRTPTPVLHVSINPAALAEIVVDADIASFAIEERSGQDARLLGIAEALAAADTERDGGRLAYHTISVSLVAHLIHIWGRRRPSDTNAMTAARLRRVRDYIDAHLDGTVTIETLASAANLSPYHFCRCFKRAVGETPHRYVMRLRAERATSLLSNDASSGLADVAQLCGFSDQSHMSRWIRRCYRTTPGLIREGLSAH